VITAVDISAPGDSDGGKVSTLIQQSEELSGSTVDQAVGDSAYSTAEAQKRAKERRIELKTKMPRPRKGLFGPGAFKLSEDLRSATCPAGHPSAKQYKARDGILHEWSRKDCGSCPLKGRCTTSERRQIRARPDFHDRRRRERWAESDEGRQLLRKRVVVEHAIGPHQEPRSWNGAILRPHQDQGAVAVDRRRGQSVADLAPADASDRVIGSYGAR